ncbi:MAG: RluA family pseudouridine synthase [Pyrinomonadaceae bacterium MAG19_C2-C3]|nr:RluA family pseudouridine synthase [Pyrinomonadaceae bacterium MAG19_C2-C3]
MKHNITFKVVERHHATRVDDYLAMNLGWLSRMYLKTCIAQGDCRVNGAQVHAGYRVREGDAVDFLCERDAPTAMTPEDVRLDVIYEDADLLVVVKPAGMLVHPTQSARQGTLANALAFYLNRHLIENHDAFMNCENPALCVTTETIMVMRPGLVHRLDRATSGLMVVAKNLVALRALSAQFQRQTITKRYLAMLAGHITDDEMTISAAIGRDPEKHPKWRVMPEGGKPAGTHLRLLERKSEATFVEFTPLTGRTNQLRIHASYINHPIIGDAWYGDDNDDAPRLCLHASRLAFQHPTSGVQMEFESALPVEMKRIWNQAGEE